MAGRTGPSGAASVVGHGCVEARTPDGRSLGVPTGARVALRGLMRGLSVDPLPMNVAGWRVFSELTPDLWVRIVDVRNSAKLGREQAVEDLQDADDHQERFVFVLSRCA